MNAQNLILSLERFGGVLPIVVNGIPPADARWKPPDGAWSILEIACHLLDEEVRDFRARLRSTLKDPSKPWSPIDPERWAISERYNQRDLGDVAVQWSRERHASVRWLRGLSNIDWNTTHRFPDGRSLRAGDLLTAWAAHDALHLRQIAKRLHQLDGRDGAGFSGDYAGEWRA